MPEGVTRMEYRPSQPAYWSETDLAADMRQAFDICNGCRLCHNLCPSFPALFKFVEGHDDDVSLLASSELDRVADLCFQCKLCFLKCPYTPPHRFDLDFPRLMLRSKAVRARRDGLSRTDRFLGDPDRSGALGTKAAAVANWANRQPLFRRLMEAQLGIDRRRRLPRYATVRFSRWVSRQETVPDPDVVLFSTCTVEFNEPGVGQAAMKVLDHNGIRAAVPAGQRCCGMPALDGGDVAGAQDRARANVALLAPYAAAGKPIVALQPTCAYVLREEYPLLLEGEAAAMVAKATVDLTDYLAGLAKSGRLQTDFRQEVGPYNYHVACHTRAQGGGARGRDLLQIIPGVHVTRVEQCAGIDGTWGLKATYYDEAKKVAQRLDRGLAQHPDYPTCSDCKLAGLQIEETTGRPPSHPVEVLARAYGLMESS